MCTKIDTKNIGGNKINIYSSDTLPQYLYNCDTIIEIAEMNDSVYITYLTGNNENVVLNYNSEGLYDKGIHENETGTSIYISENDATMMQPNTYEMSEELQEFIDECIDNGDIEELYNIEQLNVFEVDGNYAIEEKLPFDQANNINQIKVYSASTPTTDLALLSSLKNDFSMYTNKSVLSQSKYCSYLKKNVSVVIKEDRNSYKRVSANWNSFNVGTSLTIICTALSLPESALVAVLTGACVGISAKDTILSAVKLSSSAVYSYNGNRYGYAYDTTVWKDNVLVQVKKSKGEFTGGYDKDGNFTWIISTTPSAFKESTPTWANNVIKYYNSDLVSSKGKTSFQPD
ncbi:MAG: hypothetical protein AB7E42_08350 [Anaerotignaceae bacterium]